MYFYLKGTINAIFNERIILETNNVGYSILVSRTNRYKVGENKQVFLYEHIHDDEHYLVGFDNLEEKKYFLYLISVSGLGPKTALSMLKVANGEDIFNAIASSNIAFLKKLPGVGSKGAEQIVLDLKGRIFGRRIKPSCYNEAVLALREMGYKKKQIEEVISNINDPTLNLDELLKLALARLKNWYGSNCW